MIIIKNSIIKYSRLLYERFLNLASSGNISVLHNDNIYITPAGKFKAHLKAKDIAIIDRDGNTLNNNLPSSEFKMHIEIYKKRKDVKTVIHAHGFFASLIGILSLDYSQYMLFPETLLNIGIPAKIAYYPPSSSELAVKTAEAFDKSSVVYMANNGITAVGSNLFEAFCRIESAEFFSKAVYFLRNEPHIHKLCHGDIKKLINSEKQIQ